MPLDTTDEDPAHVKAHATGRWAEILFLALSNRVAKRWKFVSFRGSNKGEWRGVVDVLAVRKSTASPNKSPLKRGDLFDIVLVQLKGGSAPAPTAEDRARLAAVAKQYRAKHVVQFVWKKGVSASFFKLNRRLEWEPSSATELFE